VLPINLWCKSPIRRPPFNPSGHDGADGGKFMLEFKKTLENWEQEIV
jgi:hypothetical protein